MALYKFDYLTIIIIVIVIIIIIINALVTLVKTKHCLKNLHKTVRTTCRISELVRQQVPDPYTSDRKRPTAIWNYLSFDLRYQIL